MGVACDLFSCKHTNGVVEDVQNYVTPYDPRIQELARDLRYDPDTMYRYARDMPYKLDADGEGDKWYKPVETLDRGVKDCLDGSVLLNSLLIASGYNSWTSLVYLPLSDEFHAYVQAVINNELVTLETTCPSCKLGELSGEPVLKILDFDDTGLLVIHEDSVLAS